MSATATLILSVLVLGLFAGITDDLRDRTGADATQSSVHFTAVNVYIDPVGQPLAAYQLELKTSGVDATLVGIEGGDHPAFAQAPYYDPRANLNHRIILAAFNTGEDLPRRRTRVATVMLRIEGSGAAAAGHYLATLQVAASADAKPIHVNLEVLEGAAP